MPETRVRIPVAVLLSARIYGAFRLSRALMARVMAPLDAARMLGAVERPADEFEQVRPKRPVASTAALIPVCLR